jgi:hypothetical protein
MSLVRPLGSTKVKKSNEVDAEGNIRELVHGDGTSLSQADSDSEIAASDLSTLMRRVSGASTREIDNLMGELRALREKLQMTDGNRVQHDIAEYAGLNQSVIQLTKIISDGVAQVKKLPDAPSTAGLASSIGAAASREI